MIIQFIRRHKKEERISENQSEQTGRQIPGGVMPDDVFVKRVGSALSIGAQGCLVLFEVDVPAPAAGSEHKKTDAAVSNHVMAVLTQNFRKSDYFSQLKENLFAVWLTDFNMADEVCISRRVSAINDKLLHPREGIVSATVSAGAAFGWSAASFKELYKKAGRALYQVQIGGRCGCRIYADG